MICVNRLFWSPWAGCRPSLFFLAMFHTNSIITVAGLARMSLQASLSNVAAYFTIVRLLGPCSVGAVYKKHQQDGKGPHDDLLSLHYCVGIWGPPTIPSHVRLRKPFRTKSNWGPQLMEQYSLFSGCDFIPASRSFPRGGNGRSTPLGGDPCALLLAEQ